MSRLSDLKKALRSKRYRLQRRHSSALDSAGSVWSYITRRIRRLARVLAPGLIVLAFFGVGAAYFVPQISDFSLFTVSMSVSARTDIFEFQLDPARRYRWRLPSGEFLTESEPEPDVADDRCAVLGSRFECKADTVVEVRGDATVRFSVEQVSEWPNERGPFLVIEVFLTDATQDDARFEASVFDSRGQLQLKSTADFAYQSKSIKTRIRFPVVATHATIGARLAEASIPFDEDYLPWPHMVRSGEVQIFAARGDSRERFPVYSETLSTGDLIVMKPEKQDPKNVSHIWGFVVVDPAAGAGEPRDESSDTGFVESNEFEVVLHMTAPRTGHRDFPRVRVSRFGTTGAHELGVSNWAVISNYPYLQEIWVVILSLILIGDFLLQVDVVQLEAQSESHLRKLEEDPQDRDDDD